MEAATYVRLSASGLGQGAPGLKDQRQRTARFVRERDWTLAHDLHDADVSAWSGAARPGMAELVELVRDRRIGAVVVFKLDRAFRNLRDATAFLDECRQAGVVFASVAEGIDTSTPYGSVLFAIMASLAELESQTRSDRIKAWHERRAEAGLPSGGGDRPYGFKDDRVTHDPAEARRLRTTADRILSGRSTLRAESKRLGLTTTGLRRALTSPRTAGLRQHGEKTHPAVWKPLLAEATWLGLRELFDANNGPGTSARRYLLTGGLAICGRCGHRLVARPKADGRRCYVCPPDGGCGKIRVLSVPLEEYVAGEVARREEEHPRPQEPPKRVTERSLRSQLTSDETALEQLARDRYVTRSITDAEFRAARSGLAERIAELQEQLAAAVRGPRKVFRRLLIPTPWEVEVGEDPDQDELDGWRRWVADYVEAVVVKPAVKGRNFFTSDRVEIGWADLRRR